MSERFGKLRKLMAKTTPAPWSHYRAKLRPNFGGIVNEVQCEQRRKPIVQWGGFDNSDRPEPKHAANAAFIAEARNQLPEVLSALDAAEAEVARLREALAKIATYPSRYTINTTFTLVQEIARAALAPKEETR